VTNLSISVNKFISSTGLCSRREADKWIEAGRIKINDKTAQKGNRVLPSDQVMVDGNIIQNKVKPIYIALNKPSGITCTTDHRDKDNIIDFVNYEHRIFPIGRLDKASSGLILLTNNGDIVNKILRVENHHEKEYIVTVNRPITSKFIQQIRNGVPILGKTTKKCQANLVSRNTFRIILTQGLNRQIRRMCEYLNYRVVTLNRIRIMNISLDRLKIGHWRKLTKPELSELMEKLSSY